VAQRLETFPACLPDFYWDYYFIEKSNLKKGA
jgi:hypothetical protein